MPENKKYSFDEAVEYCKELATSHYENFTVTTCLLPKKLLPHFYSIYAYCRYSDDLGDEIGDTGKSMQALLNWEKSLYRMYDGEARHPIFVALSSTVKTFDIPVQPFANLLKAFRMDQTVKRYQTFEDLLGYCENSANPVGHLVLYLFGYRDEYRQKLSDAACTALQLANFWQDIAVDYRKGRVYVPIEDMIRFGVTEDDIASKMVTDNFKKLIEFEIKRTEKIFKKGLKLVYNVRPRYAALTIELFSRGGMEILSSIRKTRYDIFYHRPELTKRDKRNITLKSIIKGNWV